MRWCDLAIGSTYSRKNWEKYKLFRCLVFSQSSHTLKQDCKKSKQAKSSPTQTLNLELRKEKFFCIGTVSYLCSQLLQTNLVILTTTFIFNTAFWNHSSNYTCIFITYVCVMYIYVIYICIYIVPFFTW
jgi:hypothetical protein